MSETQAVAAVATPKLTRTEKLLARAKVLAERIANDTEAYNAIKLELDGAEALKSVDAGSLIKIKLGRKFADKDTTRVVVASVIAVREDEEGAKQYKVSYGSGFDADITVVGASQIVEVADAVGVFASDAAA